MLCGCAIYILHRWALGNERECGARVCLRRKNASRTTCEYMCFCLNESLCSLFFSIQLHILVISLILTILLLLREVKHKILRVTQYSTCDTRQIWPEPIFQIVDSVSVLTFCIHSRNKRNSRILIASNHISRAILSIGFNGTNLVKSWRRLKQKMNNSNNMRCDSRPYCPCNKVDNRFAWFSRSSCLFSVLQIWFMTYRTHKKKIGSE